MYTLCGSRENVIYKNKTIWTNLSMKLNIALSSGKLKKPPKLSTNSIRFYFTKQCSDS